MLDHTSSTTGSDKIHGSGDIGSGLEQLSSLISPIDDIADWFYGNQQLVSLLDNYNVAL
jgi:hypothetical protein